MVILVLLFLVICLSIIYLEFYKWKINKKTANFNKLKEWPVFGMGHRMIGIKNEEVMDTMHKWSYEAGSPYRAWMGPYLLIGIDDPDNIQIVLNSNECLNKSYQYFFLRNETGIFSSRAELWKKDRKALNPTFNHKILMGFVPTINEKSQIFIKQLEEYIDKPFDVYRPFYKLFSDTLINTVLDTKWNMQSKIGDKAYEIYMEFMSLVQKRFVRFWLKWDFIYSFTSDCRAEQRLLRDGYEILHKIKDEKEVELADNLKHGVDILENSRNENTLNWIQKCFMLQREGKFTDLNVIEQIDTIYVGGTDTSMVTAVSTIIMLAIHQDVQQKVVAEIREILGNDINRSITYDDVTKMTYLEMVIKESLRHFPVGPFIARECSDDLQIKDGIIPKGAIVLINVFKLHKDPDIWGPNVDKFYPEHFLPDVISRMHPYSYLAFSAGPRNCVGIKYGYLTVKIALCYVLRRFQLNSHLKMEDIKTKVNCILKIANEHPVKIVKRDW